MYDIRVHVLNEMIFFTCHFGWWHWFKWSGVWHVPHPLGLWLLILSLFIWSFMSPYQYVLRIDGHTHTSLSLSLPLPPILCLYAYINIYIYIHMHSFIFYLFLHIWSQFVISYVCCMYVAYVTWQHVRLPPEAAEAAGLHFAGENALQRRWAVHGWC